METVRYWRHGESVAAKVTKDKSGTIIMQMEGEKYPFPTFPRGHLLMGNNGEYPLLSKLKHEIKNQIFNDSWWALERGENKEEIIANIKKKLLIDMAELAKGLEYEMLPPDKMTPSAREIYRAWTKVSPETGSLRDYLCFILQEDDGYRFRVQWLVKWFGWLAKLNPVKAFDYALKMLEHGEIVSDMKERQRLLRRVLMLALEDENIRKKFIALFREINWRKVKLSKADAYFFRGKWFKVDLDKFEY